MLKVANKTILVIVKKEILDEATELKQSIEQNKLSVMSVAELRELNEELPLILRQSFHLLLIGKEIFDLENISFDVLRDYHARKLIISDNRYANKYFPILAKIKGSGFVDEQLIVNDIRSITEFAKPIRITDIKSYCDEGAIIVNARISNPYEIGAISDEIVKYLLVKFQRPQSDLIVARMIFEMLMFFAVNFAVKDNLRRVINLSVNLTEDRILTSVSFKSKTFGFSEFVQNSFTGKLESIILKLSNLLSLSLESESGRVDILVNKFFNKDYHSLVLQNYSLQNIQDKNTAYFELINIEDLKSKFASELAVMEMLLFKGAGRGTVEEEGKNKDQEAALLDLREFEARNENLYKENHALEYRVRDLEERYKRLLEKSKTDRKEGYRQDQVDNLKSNFADLENKLNFYKEKEKEYFQKNGDLNQQVIRLSKEKKANEIAIEKLNETIKNLREQLGKYEKKYG